MNQGHPSFSILLVLSIASLLILQVLEAGILTTSATLMSIITGILGCGVILTNDNKIIRTDSIPQCNFFTRLFV